MDYNVFVTKQAQEDLDCFVRYLLFTKRSKLAAQNLLKEFSIAIELLKTNAESFKFCDNPRLMLKGYRRLNFSRLRYFLIYNVEENSVFVDAVFHQLQDYASVLV